MVYAGNAVYAAFQKGENYEKENTCIVSDMCTGCRNACRMRKQRQQRQQSGRKFAGHRVCKRRSAAADEVAELIDAIYVQERTDKTDEQCAAAKEAWDKLTDAQKALVSGENADPDYFGRDTGDASKDDPLNQDNIGDNEILVVSFGTSFNDSRVADISGVEKAIQAANPDWAVAGHLPHRSLSITYRQEMARRSTT